jgi:predicted molibdopterin-dependent oxidoreductase YjgC
MAFGPHHDSAGALEMGLTPECLPGYVAAGDAAARATYEKAWGRTLPGAGLSAREALTAAAEGKVRALWFFADELLSSAPTAPWSRRRSRSASWSSSTSCS